MDKRLGILLFAVSLTAISARAETEASPSYMVPVPQELASFATLQYSRFATVEDGWHFEYLIFPSYGSHGRTDGPDRIFWSASSLRKF